MNKYKVGSLVKVLKDSKRGTIVNNSVGYILAEYPNDYFGPQDIELLVDGGAESRLSRLAAVAHRLRDAGNTVGLPGCQFDGTRSLEYSENLCL